MKEHWSELQGTLGAFGGLSSIIEGLGAFCSAARADDIRGFFKAHPAPAAERTLRQTLERIETCAAMAAAQQPALTQWIAAAGSAPGR